MITVKGEKNMKSIRRGVFETNSSSTHSITMCAKEDYDNWQNGKKFFNAGKNKFVSMEDITEMFPDLTGTRGMEDITQFLRDHDIHTYESYFNDGSGLEDFSSTFTTNGGEGVVAFGKYGYN